jgi:arylsulfatase A-like enzyme
MRHGINSPLLLGLTALAACVTAGVPAARGQEPPRPHIVHIVADDLGWRDVGFHGSPDIKTPNIDKLAAGGARLESFYATPLCTPTRAALMTGRYPFRYGLQSFVIPAALTYGLPTDEWTLPQALKQAGYRTAIIGKWHLGHGDRKFWPRQRGFDHFYGFLASENDYFKREVLGVPDWWRDNRPVREQGYTTTLLGDEAVKLIGAHDPAEPLYLYLAFNAPHTPYQAPKEYLDRYAAIADPTRRTYAAMVAALDDQVGRVVEVLQKRKLQDNTLIVFHSDNGGLRDAKMAGEVAAKPVADNGPYRAGKGTLYEGGTRVVALINWPGRIKAGSRVDPLLHAVDLYPTFVGLAGGRTDKAKLLDGVDIWATISQGKPSPRTEVIYNLEPSVAAVRQGDWKLVWHASLPASTELYNLAEDPDEKADVAAMHPEEAAALQKRLDKLATEQAPPLFTRATAELIGNLPPVLPHATPVSDGTRRRTQRNRTSSLR